MTPRLDDALAIAVSRASAPTDGEPLPEVSHRAIVAAVVRRGGPRLLEASLLPSLLFWMCLTLGSIGLAYLMAITWTYGCLVRRVLKGDPVTGVLVLASVGITVRTALAVGSGSTFVYFAQPIIGTALTGTAFLVSLVIGRPLIGKLAHDFWPITPEQAQLPSVQRLMRRLTALWALVNFATATMTFVLLRSLSIGTYVAAKQLTGWTITVTAVLLTIGWAHRTASDEGIIAPRQRRFRRASVADLAVGDAPLDLAAA